MTKKNFLKRKLELLLLPRLKFLGGILIFCGFGALGYSIFSSAQTPPVSEFTFSDEVEVSGLDLSPTPIVKNEIVYLGIIGFWIIGASCLFYARHQSRKLRKDEFK